MTRTTGVAAVAKVRRTANSGAGLLAAGLTAVGLTAAALLVPGLTASAGAHALRPAASGIRAEAADDDGPSVTVTGSGFGHGVGLSQYGALGMARSGASAWKILTHYYSGTSVAGYNDNVDLLVNVVDRGTQVNLGTTALAAGGGAMQLVPSSGRAIGVVPGAQVVVEVDGTALKVTVTPPNGSPTSVSTRALTVRWSGARGLKGRASALEVDSTSANAGVTTDKQRSYRYGVLRLVPVQRTDSDSSTATRIEGVLTVNLHREYLRGLAEVPQSWPMAALQAQVVAARSYALTEYRAGASAVCGGCHLWDDARSQVYRGWDVERVAPRWVSAVRSTQTSSTRGLTVLYHRTPVRAYYSSSSGGRTRDAASAWGTAVPYLRSVADPWSTDPSVNPSYAKWQRTVPMDTVLSAFGLPDVASIAVTRKDGAGAAVQVTATSSDGTTSVVSGTTLRSRLNLPAPWYTSFQLP